ncbi:hypothetical protein [Synoicihabitans lomoniglobus]|uniref:SRPBCC family protein n=1 Tax=Synoicihabitans lomoniglobus TaxID=2909285 RepID=A0AAE9ZW72_9BACT|nr:hypothetical protein [Opitutaceae bacterium LMO-M01]WED65371.1 hypothetical protein PXH66_00725 [Opitutaceae bacterium LMO-M01]
MKNVTEIAFLSQPKSVVFDFLANVENLPKWATEYCESGRWDGDTFKVMTSQGEMITRFETDARTGVIDMWARSPGEAESGVFPLRVLELAPEQTAVIFTFFQPQGMPDQLFARQHASLRIEMDELPAIMRGHLEDSLATAS